MSNIRLLIFTLFLFLFPIWFLPFSSDPYEYQKVIFVVGFLLLSTVLILLSAVSNHHWRIRIDPVLTGLIILSLIAIVSMLTRLPNPITAITYPTSLITIITGTLLYSIILNLKSDENSDSAPYVLIASGLITGLLCLLSILGIIPAALFRPNGSLLVSAAFMLILTIYLIPDILHNLSHSKEKDFRLPVALTIVFFFVISSIASAWTSLKRDRPVILPLGNSLRTLIGTWRDPQGFMLGTGPGAYSVAYSFLKSPQTNLKPYWTVVFNDGFSWVFTMATELGAGFLLVYGCILIYLIRTYLSEPSRLVLAAIAAWITLILIPGSMLIWIVACVLTALSSQNLREWEFQPRILRFPLVVIGFFIIIVIGYFTSRSFLAEFFYKQSLDALNKQDGTRVYGLQKHTLIFNPYFERYQIAFSQTNLALANALAAKKNLMDEEKNNIPHLVQQSIQYARLAATTNRTSLIAWDHLALTYESLINFAQGSQTWALEAYRQMVILDPNGATTRLRMGLLLKNLGQNNNALTYLNDAIRLKPDYPAAYFQLGILSMEEKNPDQAKSSFEKLLTLIPKGSSDEKLVQLKLDELAGKKPNNANPKSSSSDIEPTPSLSLPSLN